MLLKSNSPRTIKARRISALVTVACVWAFVIGVFGTSREMLSQERLEKKLLFVDDHSIASRDGVVRVWQQAKKANDARPIRFWRRDDQGRRVPLKASIYASALYDESRGVFQMWCRVLPGLAPGITLEGTETLKYLRYGYCESRDGLDFDFVSELKGLHSNGDYSIVVSLDPHAIDPRRRYKAGYDGAPPGFPNGACLAYSGDGIHWTAYHDGKPVMGRAADFTNGLIWDEAASVYRLFTRTDYGSGGGLGEIRGARMMTNPDVDRSPAEWKTVHEWKLDREGPEEHRRRQLYTLTDWQYSGVHFGLCSIYEWPYDLGEGKATDLVKRHERDVLNTYLVTSRDAVHWNLDSIYSGETLIERGGDNTWDKDMVVPASWVITRGDEHWLYYGGANERHGVAEIFQPKRETLIGLAKLPRDRFVGLRASDRPGVVVTKPLRLSTPSIVLNADARGGQIAIELLDADGRPLPGLSDAAAVTLKDVDDLAHRVNWKSADLDRVLGKDIQLRFRLRNATLYAMHFVGSP